MQQISECNKQKRKQMQQMQLTDNTAKSNAHNLCNGTNKQTNAKSQLTKKQKRQNYQMH